MHRIYFEPIDINILTVSKFQKDWKAIQKHMLKYGVIIPDICRICNIDDKGFVIQNEKPVKAK